MRNWLTQNRIFFETVTAVLLSAMAICVSVAQYRIAETQIKPRMIMTFEPFPDGSYKKNLPYSEERGNKIGFQIKIENVGESAAVEFKIESEYFPFVNFESCNLVDYNNIKPKSMPFPQVLEPGEIYTMRVFATEKDKRGGPLYEIPNNVPIGIKYVLKYKAEYSLFHETTLNLLYVLTKPESKLLCRSET